MGLIAISNQHQPKHKLKYEPKHKTNQLLNVKPMIKYSILLSIVTILTIASVANTRVVHKDKDANPPPPPPSGKLQTTK